MHHQLNDRELAAELAACPLLAPNWRRALFNRAIRGINLDSQPRLIGANGRQLPKMPVMFDVQSLERFMSQQLRNIGITQKVIQEVTAISREQYANSERTSLERNQRSYFRKSRNAAVRVVLQKLFRLFLSVSSR